MQNKTRINISLNGTWNILHDKNEEYDAISITRIKNQKVTGIPSVFNVSKQGAGYSGITWYSRKLSIPAHEKLARFYFEGWYGKAEFYLDGIKIGERDYGYTPYSLYFILPESNWKTSKTYDLVVKIDNREQQGQTFQTKVFKQWGGIHRNSSLQLLPDVFIESVYFQDKVDVSTISDGKADVEYEIDYIEASINGTNGKGTMDIIDLNSSIVSKIDSFKATESKIIDNFDILELKEENDKLSSQIFSDAKITRFTAVSKGNFILWDADNPLRYELSVKTQDDEFSIDIGFRQVSTNNRGQLLLNGKPVLFLGVNRHDEHPESGTAFNTQLIEHDLSIMKDAGFTGLRPAHYPTTDFFLDVCDQLGLFVMEEVPNYIMMPDMMVNPKKLEQGRSMFKEMIKAHYNHPSVLIWSTANECKSHMPESKAMINELCKIGKSVDPNRLFHFTGYPGVQNIAELDASIAGINVYYGDSTSGQKLGPEVIGGVVDNLREFMEDEDLDMANFPIFITEFGSQAHYGYHDIHPYRAEDGYSVPYTIYTEERQAAVIETFYDQVMDRPFVSGLLVWCWRDNRYEPEIADSCSSATMKYGLLDWTGAPKLGFYALQKSIKKLKEHRKKYN